MLAIFVHNWLQAMNGSVNPLIDFCYYKVDPTLNLHV